MTIALRRQGHCQVGTGARAWQGADHEHDTHPYRGCRHPPAIINHAVWLYHCFSLSLREVELILAKRGVEVSDESLRQWGRRFGEGFAKKLRRRRPRPGDIWHLDEKFIRLNGQQHDLWRAVDQHGVVLDILVQGRRNTKAAKRDSRFAAIVKTLLKGLRSVPRLIITDQLKSDAAAKRQIRPGVRHLQSRYLHNRAENSHPPTRKRERHLQRFKSPGHSQRFLSAQGPLDQHCRPRRHRMSAATYRDARAQAFAVWREETCAQQAA
jgi:putative transposase